MDQRLLQDLDGYTGQVKDNRLSFSNLHFSEQREAYSSTLPHFGKEFSSEATLLEALENLNQDVIFLDGIKNKVYIYRSFFSRVPVYWMDGGAKGITWSNTLKSLIQFNKYEKEISKDGLNLFLRLTYIPPPFTIYDGIWKLPLNSVMIVDINSTSHRIIDLTKRDVICQSHVSFLEAKREVYSRVIDSVAEAVKKEDGFGTFLSGGVDSSIITFSYSKLVQRPFHTFSLGFSTDGYNETLQAEKIAERVGSYHHKFVIEPAEAISQLDQIYSNFEEPLADSSVLPSHFIARRAKEYVDRVLTGDGGDEVFGGYNKYYIGKLNELYTSLVPSPIHNFLLSLASKGLKSRNDNRGLIFKIKKALDAFNYDGDFFYNIVSLGFTSANMERLLKPNYLLLSDGFLPYKKILKQTATSLNDFRDIDLLLSLPGGLIPKVEFTCSNAGISYESPFLNKELWNFTKSLPESFLMKGWEKKHVLKQAFKDHFPKNFFKNPKTGFGIPVGNLLRKELKAELQEFVNPEFLRHQAIFQEDYILSITDEHLQNKGDHTFQLWAFFCFQRWYRREFC